MRKDDTLSLLTNIGNVHSALGQYQEANRQQKNALNILRGRCDDLQAQEHYRKNLEGDILLSIGLTYLRLGEYRHALNTLQQAVALFHEIRRKIREATTLTAIGGIYEAWGDYIKAIGVYDQALEIQNAISDPFGKAITLNNLAKAWDRFCRNTGTGNLQEALKLYEEALQEAKAVKTEMVVAKILNNTGEVYLHLSETGEPEYLEQALHLFQEALTKQQAMNDRTNAWITLSNIGQVYEIQGKAQDALTFYRRSIDLLEEMASFARIEEFTISLRAQAAETYQHIILLLLRTGQKEQAFDFSERARTRALIDQLGNTRLDSRSHATKAEIKRENILRATLFDLEDKLRKELNKPDNQQVQEGIQFLEQQLEKKRWEYEDHLISLKTKNPEYHSLVTVEPLSLSNIQARLHKDLTLLSYFVTPDTTVAFVITRNTFNLVELSIKENTLKAAINRARQSAKFMTRFLMN